MIIIIGVFFASLFFLARVIFVIIGLYKTPVIRSFETYGPEDHVYSPIPELLLWLGILTLSGAPWIAVFAGYHDPISWPGVMLIVLWGLTRQHPEWPQHYPSLLLLPRWYNELRERTNRYERRRIAYMWLRLPPRVRQHMHSNDTAFRLWADFVIMSWVTEEEANEVKQ